MLHALFAIASAALLTIGLDPPESATPNVPDKMEQRINHVSTYLTSDSKAEQGQALRELGSDTLADVVEAIGKVNLWEDKEAGYFSRKIAVSTEGKRGGKTLDVEVHLPEGYDAKTAYPLLIAFHGQGGNGQQFIRASVALLGEHAELLGGLAGVEGREFGDFRRLGGCLGHFFLPLVRFGHVVNSVCSLYRESFCAVQYQMLHRVKKHDPTPVNHAFR